MRACARLHENTHHTHTATLSQTSDTIDQGTGGSPSRLLAHHTNSSSIPPYRNPERKCIARVHVPCGERWENDDACVCVIPNFNLCQLGAMQAA